MSATEHELDAEWGPERVETRQQLPEEPIDAVSAPIDDNEADESNDGKYRCHAKRGHGATLAARAARNGQPPEGHAANRQHTGEEKRRESERLLGIEASDVERGAVESAQIPPTPRLALDTSDRWGL